VNRPAVVHFSPRGAADAGSWCSSFAQGPGAVLLCGRYEGIDQRFIDRHVDAGDQPGRLRALRRANCRRWCCWMPWRGCRTACSAPSHEQDSFSDGLLEGPHYSRPEALDGDDAVPPGAAVGPPRHIARWRREQSLALTARRRPDLISRRTRRRAAVARDERFLLGSVTRAIIKGFSILCRPQQVPSRTLGVEAA
jgi:tRNA (guanine37-N1)-methyltransferase